MATHYLYYNDVYALNLFDTFKFQFVNVPAVDTDKGEAADGTQIDDNEPTMADKLATLDIEKKGLIEVQERPEPLETQPPSADSVHVLLKQALHANDRPLLMDCLYNQDQKVCFLISFIY